MANININNDDKITVIYSHTGCYRGKANIFVNEYNATKLMAKDLKLTINPSGSIRCNWCYQNHYGSDIAKMIREHYNFSGQISVFGVNL